MKIRHIITTLYTLMVFVSAQAQQKVTIRGTIIDDDRLPLELAMVSIEGESLVGTRADLKGRYELTCNSADSLVVVFSMVGYQTRKRVLMEPKDTLRLDVMLPRLGFELGQVEVKDVRRQTNTMTDVNLSDVKHMGNASGQGIEQIIATQAGVSTHNELSNQYNVRGGSFDENSVYINGIEVYRPLLIRSGQQEGLSIINPDMVEKVQFSAGGFDAKYGDKMASVLDITYKRPTRLEASASASMMGAAGFVGYGNQSFSMSHAVRYKTTKNLLGTTDTHGEYDPKDFDYQTYLSWSPSKRWTLDLIGNIARNDYNFTPTDRTTKFGTAEEAHEFKVYFDGKEQDKFHTYFGAISLTHKFNDQHQLTLNYSAFETKEAETYDIQGEYWLDSEDYQIGTYKEHARNRLTATVKSIGLTGRSRFTAHELNYGILTKNEHINESMREWEMRDSAGYSLPHSENRLDLIYSLRSQNRIKSNRLEAFVQDTWRKEYPEGELILNYGVRVANWSYNKETIISPRATVAFVPTNHEDWIFRFSTGIYYQAPFYKELKDTTNVSGIGSVTLNQHIKSQKSIHFVLGAEYKFRVDNRPFKATGEAYYKILSDLNPYNVDNVRLSYYGENCATGYALGLDLKIYGEFVPNTSSWVSIGLMSTRETIHGKTVPRPTDQLFNLNMLFSDYFPNTDKWKITVKGHYADGLPFGPPHTGREKQVFRMRAYRRVDLGISYRLMKEDKERDRKWWNVRNIWIGLDAFNILDVNNVNSYYWVTDITNNQYAVPNYLTGRQINARILIEI
ncbi:MAG: carboxypeptidase-like regulatory domain-containing protein [Bacteroidaceae bacterium]|nr:carboxypeptidase-like regulatory domain-containing protein [Bacteroidaceae bacterium]